MPARLPFALLLALSTLGWYLVTRGAFDESRRSYRHRNSERPLDPPEMTLGADDDLLAPMRLRIEDPVPDASLAIEREGHAALVVQSGRRLHLLELEGGRVLRRASLELPESCYVWDLFGDPASEEHGVLSFGSAAVHRLRFGGEEPIRLAAPGDLFRGLPTRPPLHRELALARGEDVAFVVPSVDRLRWQRIASDASTAELVQDVPTPSLAEQTLGYGLADVMSSRVAVPFFHLARTTGEQVLLFRRGDRLLRRHADGRESSFGRAPQGGNREILGFDHTVAPLVGDWDGDGEADIVFSVPGDGTVLAYRSATREGDDERGPDQALVINGWILHHWLIDGDGDGRHDLALLEVPKLNALGQLTVLRQNRMNATLTLRPQLDDGSFDPTPKWSRSFALPVAITLKRKERFVQFPSPVAPLLDPRHGLLLLHPEAGELVLTQHRGGAFETRYELGALPEDATVRNPFDPVFAQLDGVGGYDLALVLVTATSRVLEVFRLP